MRADIGQSMPGKFHAIGTFTIDARKLFDVAPGDEVVIRGTGTVIDDLNLFQVKAEAMHVRSTGGP